MARKVDFDIELVQDADIAIGKVKAGQELAVVADEASGRLQCSTADGMLLGAVPEASAVQLHGAINVTVRSIKKKADAPDKVAGIQARAVPADASAAAAAPPQQPAPSAAQQPEDPSGYAITVSQLQRLADDPALVLTLQDERLQKLLLQIDGAPDREKALEQALAQEAFKKFADQVLSLIAEKDK